MTTAFETEVDGQSALIFHALEVTLASGYIRLLEGPLTLSIESHTFTGEDTVAGTYSPPAEITDGIAGEVSNLSITFNPPSDADAVTLLGLLVQGCAVRSLFGAIDRTTGLLIGSVIDDFVGTIDVATLNAGMNSCSVTMECESVWARLQEPDQGLTMTDACWQATFGSGELMFQYTSDVERQIPWGSTGPRASINVISSSPPSSQPGQFGGGFIGGIVSDVLRQQ